MILLSVLSIIFLDYSSSSVLTSLKMPNKGTSTYSSSSKSFQQMPPMFNYHQYPYYYLALNDSDSIPDEQRLMAYLLRNYDPSARPVYNASNTVSVAFGISLTQLSDMVRELKTYLCVRSISRNLINLFI